MIIAIEGNEANTNIRVGVSNYCYYLIKEFSKIKTNNIKFNVILKNDPVSDLPVANNQLQYQIVKGSPMWLRFWVSLHLLKKRLLNSYNLYFAPAHYTPKFIFFPLVVTIHDLAYLYFPDEFKKIDLYKLNNWTKESVLKAKQIIAVSKTTKKDLIKNYQIQEDKIKVIYNGFTQPKDDYKTEKLSFNLAEKKYFIFIGTLQPRKNITRLIKAFEVFKDRTGSDFKLVIVGKKGWFYDKIFHQTNQSKYKSDIIFTDYVEDKVKNRLLQTAFAYINPGLYEGFGMPILDAFYFKIPTAVSFTGALPEVGGKAVEYFNPYQVQDIAKSMYDLFQYPRLRQNLIKEGTNRLKEFSWKNTAEKTLEVFIANAKV
ncbi:MAG: glycosyl transferase family 1 [Patescibacteria group bacterium]|nr:MAG: glycosyl transferase family 1 [Patescibacteria group bacterium]